MTLLEISKNHIQRNGFSFFLFFLFLCVLHTDTAGKENAWNLNMEEALYNYVHDFVQSSHSHVSEKSPTIMKQDKLQKNKTKQKNLIEKYIQV